MDVRRETIQPPSSLEDEALAWVARLHSGHATDQDRRACEAWQHVSPSHAEAFQNASHLWEELGHAGSRRRPRARLRRWSLICCVLLLIGWFSWEPFLQQVRLQTAHHRTAVGQQEPFVLPDGSRLVLNTDTALNVLFSAQQREILLLKGEAAFAVAPDPARPFTVRSHDTATTALGTRFVVHTGTDSVTVTVTEHAVQLSSSKTSWSSPGVLQEGQQISYSANAGWSAAHAVDPAQVAAWQRGKIIFDAQPLGAVVADLNRYRHGHIFILNPALRSLPVTGVFEINDPDAALRIIEQTLGIRDTQLSPYFLFLH